MRALVIAALLAACGQQRDLTPTPIEHRAPGDGFTIALPDGWDVGNRFDDAILFRAVGSRGRMFQVTELAENDRDVLGSDRACRSWGEKLAKGVDGVIVGVSFSNGACDAHIKSSEIMTHVYARAHGTKRYGMTCISPGEMSSIESACAAMVTSWRDDPDATPKPRTPRVVVAFENGRFVVRAKAFTLTFSTEWHIAEGDGADLLHASADSGGQVTIGVVEQDVGDITSDECSMLASSFADRLNATSKRGRLVRSSAGEGCRVEISGSQLLWAYFVPAPDGRTYVFGCTALKGDSADAACAEVLASWTFTRGE